MYSRTANGLSFFIQIKQIKQKNAHPSHCQEFMVVSVFDT